MTNNNKYYFKDYIHNLECPCYIEFVMDEPETLNDLRGTIFRNRIILHYSIECKYHNKEAQHQRERRN